MVAAVDVVAVDVEEVLEVFRVCLVFLLNVEVDFLCDLKEFKVSRLNDCCAIS
jgi:hypothetical protein